MILTAGCSRASPKAPEGAYDAGPVFAEATPKVSHVFSVTNTTGKTVQILDESHSCVCTKVEFERRTLKPGESMPLTMEVAVPYQKVELNLSCTLRCDSPDYPLWTYHILLHAYPMSEIEPTRIVLTEDQGAAERPREPDAYLTCYNLRESKIPPIQNLVAPSDFNVEFGTNPQLTTLPDGVRQYRVPISLHKKGVSASSGTHAEPLNFRVSETPLMAMVVWKTRGPLSVTPSSVSFGMFDEQAAPKSLHITVKSSDRRPFGLVTLDGGDPAARFVTESAGSLPKTEHELVLEFDPARSSHRRVLTGTATIQTDLDGAGVCSVHWSAFTRSKTSVSSN